MASTQRWILLREGRDQIISAGTSTDTLTLNPDEAVFYVFPVTFLDPNGVFRLAY